MAVHNSRSSLGHTAQREAQGRHVREVEEELGPLRVLGGATAVARLSQAFSAKKPGQLL